MYIDDITESVMNSKILLFADDSKISKLIESDKDASDFQSDIN